MTSNPHFSQAAFFISNKDKDIDIIHRTSAVSIIAIFVVVLSDGTIAGGTAGKVADPAPPQPQATIRTIERPPSLCRKSHL